MTQRILFEYLLNTLWQVPLLALATWLLIRLARPALLLQHSLWTAALILGVLLPLRGIAPVSAAAPARDGVLYPAFAAEPTLYLAQPFSPPAPRRPSLFTSHIHPLQLADSTISLLLELYAVTIAFSFARLIHGYLATRRIAAAAVAHPLTTLESTLLKACAHHLNLREPRIPELRFLADPNASPMIVGLRNPILLLPESLRHAGNPHFDDRALTAVLAHELAHIRRRDFLANLLTRILSLPIAYHPATQILHGRIRQTREMICDAHASLAFDAPSTYARSLLSLAATLIHAHAPAEAVGLFPHTRNMPVRKLEETHHEAHRITLAPHLRPARHTRRSRCRNYPRRHRRRRHAASQTRFTHRLRRRPVRPPAARGRSAEPPSAQSRPRTHTCPEPASLAARH